MSLPSSFFLRSPDFVSSQSMRDTLSPLLEVVDVILKVGFANDPRFQVPGRAPTDLCIPQAPRRPPRTFARHPRRRIKSSPRSTQLFRCVVF